MPAHKNRGIQTRSGWKDRAVFASLLLMIVSVVVSRAALSSSTILFLLLTIIDKGFKQQWKYFISRLYFISFTLLFFLPFLSGLWSQDLSQWTNVVRLKLPLLFFPLAFAGCWQFTKLQWLI